MIPAGVLRDLQDGRLSQRCPVPSCSVVEAAGSYSTCHSIPTGPGDWYRATRSEAERAGHPGASNPEIAKVAGVSEGTVRNVKNAGAQIYAPDAEPARVIGADGKSYPGAGPPERSWAAVETGGPARSHKAEPSTTPTATAAVRRPRRRLSWSRRRPTAS